MKFWISIKVPLPAQFSTYDHNITTKKHSSLSNKFYCLSRHYRHMQWIEYKYRKIGCQKMRDKSDSRLTMSPTGGVRTNYAWDTRRIIHRAVHQIQIECENKIMKWLKVAPKLINIIQMRLIVNDILVLTPEIPNKVTVNYYWVFIGIIHFAQLEGERFFLLRFLCGVFVLWHFSVWNDIIKYFLFLPYL